MRHCNEELYNVQAYQCSLNSVEGVGNVPYRLCHHCDILP